MGSRYEELMDLGYSARREKRPADALRCFVQAAEMSRDSGDREALARALTGWGQMERDSGRLESALQLYEQAAAIYRAEGNALRLAHTIRHAGDIQVEAGRNDAAEPLYSEALKIYRSDPDTDGLDLANAIRGFAIQRSRAAAALWAEAREGYQAAGVEAGVEECARQLARWS